MDTEKEGTGANVVLDMTIAALISDVPTESTKHIINGTAAQYSTSLYGTGTNNPNDTGEAQYCQPVSARKNRGGSSSSSSSSQRQETLEEKSVLGGSMAASVALGSHPTRQERSGDLSTGEHAVVKKVAEDRLRLGLGMCRKAVMYEYHRVFPGYTRNHVKLMGYWKSYKDGAAWRDVVARVAKEKHQKSQPET